MREIKFRGKRTDNGEWVYGVPIQVGLSKCVVMCRDVGSLVDNILSNPPQQRVNWVVISKTEVIPETVGQYTGLKDRNGNKIYEGDIVKRTHRHFKGANETIPFDKKEADATFTIEYRNGGFYLTPNYLFDLSKSEYEIVVVGNIHDKGSE